MNTKFKIFIAILVAPLAALASYVLLTLVQAILVKLLTSEVVTFIDVVGNVSVAPYTLAIAYPATLIIGLPTHFFLRLIKRNTVSSHLIAGSIFGVTIAFIIAVAGKGEEMGALQTIYLCILFFMCTVAVSTTFGVIANHNVTGKTKNARA